MIYVVLGVLILAFIFFVGNTIRCYLNKPKYVDEDDENELEDSVNTKHWLKSLITYNHTNSIINIELVRCSFEVIGKIIANQSTSSISISGSSSLSI